MRSISFEVLIAFRWWPSLAETSKGLILLLKTLLLLMEFNPNFAYMGCIVLRLSRLRYPVRGFHLRYFVASFKYEYVEVNQIYHYHFLHFPFGFSLLLYYIGLLNDLFYWCKVLNNLESKGRGRGLWTGFVWLRMERSDGLFWTP
jgi:hypothetical protein